MKTTALLFGLVLTATVNAQEAWTARSTFPGLARWGVACFDINGIGYMVGGRTANDVDLNELWAYDPTTDSWQQKAPIPGTLRVPCAFTLGGKGYVTCGATGSGTHLDATWEYNPATDTWTAKATFPGAGRFGATSFILNGQGYVCCGGTGGAAGPYESDLWRYDPVQNLWSARAALPDQGRVGAAGFSADGKGYVMAGLQADQSFTNELWAYDPGTNSWAIRASLPGEGMSYAEAYSVGNIGVVVGGHGMNSDPFNCWYYTPGTNSWTSLPNYVGSATWTGASMVIGDRIFAGLGQGFGNVYGDFYELTGFAVGIQDITSARPSTLFPNPCRAGGQMVLDLTQAGSGSRLEILNALGQLVDDEPINGKRQVFTLPQLPTGSYACLIKQQGIPIERIKLDIIQ
jgi:N-acetylneuraminic acid mutarotase